MRRLRKLDQAKLNLFPCLLTSDESNAYSGPRPSAAATQVFAVSRGELPLSGSNVQRLVNVQHVSVTRVNKIA
jgi:hypothetical protein